MNGSLKPQTLIPVIAILLIALITYFLGMKQAASLKQNKTVLAAKQAEAQALGDKITALENLASTLPQFNSEIEKLTVAYPEKESSVEALIQAQALSEKAGVSVISLAPGKPEGSSLPITFNLQGGADRIPSFFKEINDNLRPITINTVSLLSGTSDNNGVMTITVGSGFQFNAAAATPVDPTAVPATQEPLPSTN